MTGYIIWLFLFSNVQREAPLVWDTELSQLATERAEYLCETYGDDKKMSHAGMAEIFDEYPAHSWVGENIARGYHNSKTTDLKRATKTYLALMNSEGHRKNILDPRFKYTGIGTSCKITVQLFADKTI